MSKPDSEAVLPQKLVRPLATEDKSDTKQNPEGVRPPIEAMPSEELTSYTCPGELYSIPRSIHLSRMAAFYPKCNDCRHRIDSGSILSPPEKKQNRQIERRATRTTLLTDESVRGVYLNDLDRNKALSWGEALAAYLWDRQPMMARIEPIDSPQIVSTGDGKPASATRGPRVVVGFDERPSSPDIASGVVLGLRRMGCPVVDLGQTSLPAMAFNVQSLEAAAGLYVTGAGCDPSITGFDFMTRGANPFPREALLSLENFAKTGVGRQTRQIGSHQPIHGQTAYESSLASYFHALRPLKIVCGTSTRLLPRSIDRLFSKLPCELTQVSLPIRRRNLFDVRDVDLVRVGSLVVEGQHHLGLVIDEDGRHTAFVTDRGRLVSTREVARLLIELTQRENPHAKFIVATSLMFDTIRWLSGRDASAIDGGESIENLVRLLVEREAALALSADGQIWFGHAYPTCDALLVLAKVLQALSLSDAPFSEVIDRISHDADRQAVPPRQ